MFFSEECKYGYHKSMRCDALKTPQSYFPTLSTDYSRCQGKWSKRNAQGHSQRTDSQRITHTQIDFIHIDERPVRVGHVTVYRRLVSQKRTYMRARTVGGIDCGDRRSGVTSIGSEDQCRAGWRRNVQQRRWWGEIEIYMNRLQQNEEGGGKGTRNRLR